MDSYIAGGVDFIFGNAAAVFDQTEIHAIRPGFLTAQSRTAPDQTTGFVITHSTVTTGPDVTAPASGEASDGTSEQSSQRSGFFLGRPWRLYSRVVVMNTALPAGLNSAGWSVWNKSDPFPPQAFYAEFHNTGPGARPQDRATWSHQLTAREAAAFAPRIFLRGADHWDPLAEAARLP